MTEDTRVLIVDDLPENLTVLGQILKGTGYRVRATLSGELALKAAALEPPDIILLDVMMPEMDGYTVCERLKADPVTADIPVLFISALNDAADKVRAFAVGGVDFIGKPFDRREVLARVAAHAGLHRARVALAEKNEVLEKTLAELRQTQTQLVNAAKMASLGQLTAGIAHELNNPINFVHANAQTSLKLLGQIEAVLDRYDALRSGASLADWQAIEELKQQTDYEGTRKGLSQLLEGVRVGSERAADIIRSLRLFSRDAAAGATAFDLNDNLDTALLMLSHKIGRNIEVIRDYRAMPTVIGQPGALNQVFVNLFCNAIDAINDSPGKAEPRLLVRTRDGEHEGRAAVLVEFADSGAGIPPEVLSHVFEPFFTTKPVGKGTGLGLSIAWGIVRDHGGKIVAENRAEGGALFRVILPR